jgi:uncharacterized protein (DUF2141 family)
MDGSTLSNEFQDQMRPLVTLFVAGILLSFVQSERHFSLTIKVHNFRSSKGVLEIGLYRDPSKFPKIGQTFRMVRVKVENNEATYTFVNLESDQYAVCIYHDENSNKICDRNILGIPTESYAFSNNIRPRWSVPDFEECCTVLNADKTFRIQLIH